VQDVEDVGEQRGVRCLMPRQRLEQLAGARHRERQDQPVRLRQGQRPLGRLVRRTQVTELTMGEPGQQLSLDDRDVTDAPPGIGGNLRRAVDEIAAAEGVSNRVTHLVYSHHHADHASAASLFGGDVVRIGHEETRRLLLRDDDPARPVPEVTFADRYTLQVGGERVELAWHGPNHSPDNIYIHFPDHDTLMFIDVVNAGWVPIYNLNLSEDVIGYMGAPAIALAYPWTHFICGHLGRLATREDVAVHQQYIADIEASSREALAAVNPVPFYVAAGENAWAGVKGHLDAVTERAAAPIIAKYTGVLAAADIEIFTTTTTFAIMQSLRLDRGPSGPVHP
jgi:glyoxylase-like metal-dependent hydrolase (beta-lactamase superfamily II)